MKGKELHIAKSIRTEIRDVDPKAKIILFGSRARGEAKKESDWDVLVLINSLNMTRAEDLIRDKIYDLELNTGAIISLFIYDSKDWNSRHKVTPLYRNIKKEGVVL